MATTTKLKKKLKRQQLPKLTPAQLNHALALLEQTGLDATSKRALANAFTEMADSEAAATVQFLLRLPEDHQALIAAHAQNLQKLRGQTLSRASSELLTMSDEEWDALVNEADNGA
ncbi:hypothetical protein G4Y79_05175 [Phototrophicus methaneseepsis]|uniref:Uncharacterized protein n=1 Tax=Phototrophicus methaneseepsis TaxID=2710758 RepID=A0A7S8IFM9_9CHLR|nr:hypothetical protein [Phototrophicus methaneseepsis]QPC83772.1 hypothetical protein G4Y79_05175 [Phototrophicus methaneseepsis]